MPVIGEDLAPRRYAPERRALSSPMRNPVFRLVLDVWRFPTNVAQLFVVAIENILQGGVGNLISILLACQSRALHFHVEFASWDVECPHKWGAISGGRCSSNLKEHVSISILHSPSPLPSARPAAAAA